MKRAPLQRKTPLKAKTGLKARSGNGKAKKAKKRKTKTIAQLVEQAAVLLQKLRRLEESDFGYCRCVSCGEIGHWKDLQGGHWISRGKHRTKLAHWNIWPQHPGCNHPGNTLAAQRYQNWMTKYYGQEFIDDALIRCQQPIKYARWEVEEIIDHYKYWISKYEMESGHVKLD